MDSSELIKQLDEHPKLKEKVIQLVHIANNTEGIIERADEAERHITDALRTMGQETLQDWAHRQMDTVTKRVKQQKPSLRKHVKKNSSGIALTES